jgi:hypothetical protein
LRRDAGRRSDRRRVRTPPPEPAALTCLLCGELSPLTALPVLICRCMWELETPARRMACVTGVSEYLRANGEASE